MYLYINSSIKLTAQGFFKKKMCYFTYFHFHMYIVTCVIRYNNQIHIHILRNTEVFNIIQLLKKYQSKLSHCTAEIIQFNQAFFKISIIICSGRSVRYSSRLTVSFTVYTTSKNCHFGCLYVNVWIIRKCVNKNYIVYSM